VTLRGKQSKVKKSGPQMTQMTQIERMNRSGLNVLESTRFELRL
jgi:hypothetical protein